MSQEPHGQATAAWLVTLAPIAAAEATHDDALAALDTVREEPTTRHG